MDKMETPSSSDSFEKNGDLEKGGVMKDTSLTNDVVQNYAWRKINVQVKDRATGDPLSILSDTNGIVHAGEMIAIMGPSGSGKTTLLNAVAHRVAAAGATTTGDLLANGQVANLQKIRDLSSYVEQDDALIGSLTVRETVGFAAGLSLPSSVSKSERQRRVDSLIASFGLQDQAHTIVGTPIKKGLSGGQKKRLGVCSRLVTDPKILFLDEPTSGLDSTLSFEVMNYIKKIGRENNLVIIASIHQPSTATFMLFDKLFLLSRGKTCYFGPVSNAPDYFGRIGYPMPSAVNPAEFFLDLINTDLVKEGDDVVARTKDITQKWLVSKEAASINQEIEDIIAKAKQPGTSVPQLTDIHVQKPRSWAIPLVLLQRAWIKSYRDIVAYGIRIIMYLGLAILMGTVFLRFSPTQEYIQPYINAMFFSSAFMSFMAVAYVPAYLEDQATFYKERANGIVGPLAFMISNFIIGLPFLFIIAFLFAVVEYWLTGFRASGTGFMTFLMWLFFDLVAAESLVVLVSSVFPVFVVALAVTAFVNGLWMCVNGFLVPITVLNSFWKYVFHYIDYQAYVFQGMMVNEFKHRTYSCGKTAAGQHQCAYESTLNSEGMIAGVDVLKNYDINANKMGEWVGIIISIIIVYRLLGYVALRFRQG
ncbi:hypothetical protein TMatcc_000728 [Talaromyces marneffei ATCC 18224]